MRTISILTVAVAIVLLAPPADARNVKLTIHFTNQGQPLEDPMQGRFYVYDPELGENYIAWGNAARSVAVPAGVYKLVIKYVNGELAYEEVYGEVDLTEDLEHEIDFNIPFARLTMWVTSGGLPIPRHAGGFNIYRAGDRGRPLISRRPGDTVTMSPGMYDIEVVYRATDGLKSKWLENYMLEGLRQESIDIGAAVSRVRLTLLDGAQPLADEAGVWRVYRRGTRDAALAEARTGEMLVLDAGVYDIGLSYTVGGQRGERWLVDVEVTGEIDRRIDVAARSDRVTVDIRNRGRVLTDAWYELYRAGDRQNELYSARSGESVEIRPGAYDVGCFLRRGGVRAESWLESQELVGPVELQVDLEYEEASLRVRPQRRRRRTPETQSNLLMIVDSSAAMLTQLDGKTRLERLQGSLVEAVEVLTGTDSIVGLRVFGIAPRSQQDCRDSTLLVPPGRIDRRELSQALRLLRPAGHSPIGYSLEQASADLPPSGSSSVLLITGSTDSCQGDPCAAAARLMHEGGISRIYVVALGVDRDEQRQLDCIGDFRAVRSEFELQSALREIMREVRREEGSVAVFRPGWSEIVASGALLERLHVTAGVYDVLVRAGDKDFSWPGVEIRGNMVATAGSKPPR